MNEEKLEVIDVTEYKEEEVEQTGLRDFLRKMFDYLRVNSIRVEKNGNEVLTLKLIVFVILLAIAAEVILPLMFVGLFFNFKYTFMGRNSMSEMNRFMDSVSRVANAAKEGFQNSL